MKESACRKDSKKTLTAFLLLIILTCSLLFISGCSLTDKDDKKDGCSLTEAYWEAEK